MKYILLLITSLCPVFSNAQYISLEEFFFGRVPGARAEAMGKAFSAIDGDMTSVFFNPAGTASIEGLALNGSYASPYYFLHDAYYLYTAAGYRINKELFAGISRNYFSYGHIFITDIYGNIISVNKEFYVSNYTLNLSSELKNNWLLGINVNYMDWSPYIRSHGFFIDGGFIKQLRFIAVDSSVHKINFAGSVINFTHAQLNLKDTIVTRKTELPVTARAAVSYSYIYNSNAFKNLKTFHLTGQAEYKFLLNSKYNAGIHAGAEILIAELFAMRAGYYNENTRFDAFTYGAGLQLPLHKITKVPLNINFDYTNLPQPSPGYLYSWDNFSTYSFRINWLTGNNKKPD